MKGEPCKVCGCSDINLIDGFYYCVECGTQDVEVRETLVEDIVLPDGVVRFKKQRITKIKKTVEEGATMSPEWHKWHAFNYIIAGMVEEVMALGADPSFKTRVLMLWSMYMKKFQNRKELGLPEGCEEDEEDLTEEAKKTNSKNKIRKRQKSAFYAERVSNNLFFAIMYVALNLGKSEIQLTDLIRFGQEGRISFTNCYRFVPKEIDVTLIKGYKHGLWHRHLPTIKYACLYAMTFIKTLNLGAPVIPDLKKIADRYIMELCLPDDFKQLVYSLMHLVPCDYLELNDCVMKSIIRVPFYECFVMSYIVVALKMCFGLDDDYEVKLSDAVDEINKENCHLKSYKLGIFSITSDRLFSFREWCTFLKLRKVVLCKHYWPMAKLSNISVNDYVYMEQRDPPTNVRTEPSLTDDITMNMLNKMDSDNEVVVIPKSEFHATLTPLTTYTEVILNYYKDPELKLLLSEDFTKYSLKYACENLDLRTSNENIIVGVDESKKCIVKNIKQEKNQLTRKTYDSTMVYVRNCENKNWLITNPPTADHIKVGERDSDKENDNGNDSTENVLSDNEIDVNTVQAAQKETKIEHIRQEDETVNIFDDNFKNLVEYEEDKDDNDVKSEPIDTPVDDDMETAENLSDNHDHYDQEEIDNDVSIFFNPETFDREDTIKELILLTCKKYKIPVPRDYRIKEPKKRKSNHISDETHASEPKRKKVEINRSVLNSRIKINDIISAYHEDIQDDVLENIAQELRSVVQGMGGTQSSLDDSNLNEHDEINNQIRTYSISDHGTHDVAQSQTDLGVLEVDNETVDQEEARSTTTIHQEDPFNEIDYDVKQLYLKVQNCDSNDDDVFIDDPEIDEILTKKVNECIEVTDKISKKIVNEDVLETEDYSEDDIPLSKVREAKLRDRDKQKERDDYTKLKHLISNRKNINSFNYWTRYLKELQRDSLIGRFEAELKETFPKSFSFIIHECAAILDCTPCTLYPVVMELERVLRSKTDAAEESHLRVRKRLCQRSQQKESE